VPGKVRKSCCINDRCHKVIVSNERYRIPNGQSKKDNTEKVATSKGCSRRRKTKQKHNTICVGHHYMQTNTYNVNKSLALLQTTGGKDKPNVVFVNHVKKSVRNSSNVLLCSRSVSQSCFYFIRIKILEISW
jgi:hypothetical protein